LTHCFSDAAERLADSYRGEAHDDALLLPFLYLYRHAFELNLKSCITTAAACRILQGDHDPALEPAEVQRRLHHVHGHKVMSLFEELERHLAALGLKRMPKRSRTLHTWVSNTDPRGESFRYPASLPGTLGDSQDNVDFLTLREALLDGFNLAQGAHSMLDDAFQHASESTRRWRPTLARSSGPLRQSSRPRCGPSSRDTTEPRGRCREALTTAALLPRLRCGTSGVHRTPAV
jgi:hypothetical protein